MFLYGAFVTDEVDEPNVADASCEPDAVYCCSAAGRFAGFGANVSVQCCCAGAPAPSRIDQTPRSVAAHAVEPSAENRSLPIVVDSSSSPPTRLAGVNSPVVGLARR